MQRKTHIEQKQTERQTYIKTDISTDRSTDRQRQTIYSQVLYIFTIKASGAGLALGTFCMLKYTLQI